MGTDRKNKSIVYQRTRYFTEIDRAHSDWTDEQIQEISELYVVIGRKKVKKNIRILKADVE